MNFVQYTREDRRLVILRLLAEAAGTTANDSMLDSALGQVGHKVSRDTVRGDLSWLNEQGLIQLDDVGTILVAELTGRGEDVAKGEATHAGVKKPRAGS